MDQMIGRMLDNRYELLELIGSGGMAMVYKAKCHRLNRLVAVKVLKSDFASDADFRRRFYDESQAIAMLSHPNIVSVYDVSRSSPEYIVMELIDGITLKQYMERRGRLNWRESLHFITQIMKGLSHAHSRGIVHRDIKPSNIIYSPATGSLRIIDFGSADALDFTILRGPAGTERFTPPDVADSSRPADAASDFYAVGVTLTRLCAVASPARRTALEYLASEMIARRITDRDAALALYRSLGKRRWKIGLAVAALVLALVVGLAVIFLPTEKEGEPVRPVQVTAETDTVAAPPETDVHEPVGKIAPAEPEAPAPAAESDEAEAQDEWPDFVLPDEKVRDQYGVTLAEAKYLPIFKKRPVDNFTVQRTDVMLQECIIIYNKSNNSDEERTRAYDRYYSPDAIPNDVIAEVMRKYPDADRRRVEGIARRRVSFWRDAFAPLEKHPSPALHDLKP